MLTKFLQSDPQWSDFEYDKGTSIGAYGCLLTTITNGLNGLGYNYTPETFAEFLMKNKCFDNGYIVWDKFLKATGFIMTKYLFPKIPSSNKLKSFFAIQVPFQNTGHYCNILEIIDDKKIKYFDVYTGQEKITANWISIRKFEV